MPLKSWLQHNVHQHGRSKSPGDILVAATGSDLSADAYIADLTAKVADLTA